MVTPAAKREAVAHLRSAFEVSERRACSVLRTDRTSVRYRSTRPDDAAIRTRLRELASQRRRFKSSASASSSERRNDCDLHPLPRHPLGV
jgi:hypothetical protein